jgi:hypothetical protein
MVIYSTSEEGKFFVHANCVFVHEAELSGQCNASERKRPYFRVLYLVLFDTSLGGDSRNFTNLQIVNETANTMLQQCWLSWF